MFSPAPRPEVDERTAWQIAAQVRDLLPYYVPGWKSRETGPAEALVRIFSRYCEMVIKRLNEAPDKNFLAFLDFLGVTALAPQPARVPLTFFLAQKAPGATVPARTQVAAKPSPGEKDPVIFETEQELQVTAATLDSLFVKDPGSDTYADGSSMLALAPAAPGPVAVEQPTLPVFRGDKPIPHILYLGLNLPASSPVLKTLRLGFVIDGPAASGRQVVWEAIEKIAAVPAAGAPAASAREDERFTVAPLNPSSDETAGLTKSGNVVFDSFALPDELEVNGVKSRWLRCRFVPAPATQKPPSASSVTEGRVLKSVSVHSEIERAALPLQNGFANAVQVDLSKEFLPFGPRPKLGDTFYLANNEAFSLESAAVSLHFELLNPAGENAPPPIVPVQPRAAKLIWEFWDGDAWTRLGTSESQSVVRIRDEVTGFSDGTKAFSDTGNLSFKFPSVPRPVTVNGQTNYWVRVRIAGGDYGAEAHWEKDDANGYAVVPASLAPPIVAAAAVSYVIASDSAPVALWGYEDFRYTPADSQGLKLLQPAGPGGPALYLGFAPAAGQVMESSPLTAYFGLANTPAGKAASPVFNSSAVVWEYWSKTRWTPLVVHDDTNGFRGSGIVSLLGPRGFTATQEFGRERYWLRVRKADGAGDFDPALRSVLLNTTMAVQALTAVNEILGSSNGKPSQKFRTNHAPVLEGQTLHVLEPTLPSVESAELLASEEGEDAVSRLLNPFSKREEIWVRWHLVPNFNASGPQNRHYVLNRLTGEVLFGDGEIGRIPPVLPGNIRMTRYRSGGGAGGNKPAVAVSQLMTTLPYVERASNLEAASGGADAETRSELLDRAPRGVRHSRRAVAAEDYEDLAFSASPEVGRACCVPLRDLASDPTGEKLAPGVISLIVVPRSTDRRPLPSAGLLDRVQRFLDAHRLLTTDLVLLAADFVAIRVETELAITDPNVAGDVQQAATRELQRFLHPMTGGSGSGWDFGRLPAASDLYTLLEGIRGVSHVRRLSTSHIPDRPGADLTSRFLVYNSDKHEVTVTLEE